MKFICWLGIHCWTKWIDKKEGKTLYVPDGHIVGEFIVQERRCEHCNCVEYRREDV